MNTYKSEFDRPINFYNNMSRLDRDLLLDISWPDLQWLADRASTGELLTLMETLRGWGWISYSDDHMTSIRLTRPTENIYLVPRPTQEVAS